MNEKKCSKSSLASPGLAVLNHDVFLPVWMLFIAVKWDFLFCPPPSRKSRLLAVDRLPVDSQGFLWTWSAEKNRWRNGRYSSIGKTDGSTRMGCSETRSQMAAKSAEIPLGPSTDRRSLKVSPLYLIPFSQGARWPNSRHKWKNTPNGASSGWFSKKITILTNSDFQWRRSRGGSGGTCPPNFISVGATPPPTSDLHVKLFYTLLREVTNQA